MSELEQRLEDLYMADARAWRIERVGTPRRQPRWISVAGFVAGTAATLLAASLVIDVLTRERSQAGSPSPQATAPAGATAPSGGIPGLTADRKAIAQNGQTVLAIDNDQIVQWFRTQSQLCDWRNIDTRADRRSFCTDVAAFRDKTRFTTAVSSPDGMSLGFTVESDTLAFFTVAGFYARSSGKVSFLTDYYDGHEFLSFSPTGRSFVYTNICFEANCALYVRDTATLAEMIRVNGPPGDEVGRQNATFLRWLSDSQIEYKLGNEVKTASF